MFVEYATAAGNGMNAHDVMILRLAAEILDRTAVDLLSRHDPLAEPEGYVGYRAADAAREIHWFLEGAQKCGLVQPREPKPAC